MNLHNRIALKYHLIKEKKQSLTVSGHSDGDAFLQPAFNT